ncbi:MAG: flagellar motor protein MotA [Alphaproteobacteria bacterium]|nr:flagellar motor protein MotA [Alphaproteobacteria bacterium]
MSRPKRFLTRMILFLVAVVVGIIFLFPMLREAFLANPALNGMILGVLVIGIVFIFRMVLMLNPEVAWIENYRRGSLSSHPPQLLGPVATMIGDKQRKLSLSTLALRSLLDSISARLDEARDISRYLIGLLIFLGLLGTFWGLLETVASIGGVIASLEMPSAELGTAFRDLKSGLEAPLSGMGTAFSSSLFGLAGSLVLGFLDLQAGQAQNRFYNDLEEWLASQTRLSSGAGVVEGDQSVPVYIQALLEQTADNLENLQRIMSRSEERQVSAAANFVTLNERLGSLTDQMRAEQTLMVKLAESQLELKPILSKLTETAAEGNFGMDEATRIHIRNLDVHMVRLLEDAPSGRDQLVQEIRNEIKLLARTVAALSDSKSSN